MNATVFTLSALLLGSPHSLWSVSPLIAQAAEPVSKPAQTQLSTAKRNGNSAAPAGQGKDARAEEMEEELKVCLSRIPAESSIGQRLLAEQSCRKEHEIRSARHAAPEF